MANRKIFLDANILIEILESRPKSKKVQKFLFANADRLSISSLTCHIVAYVSGKSQGLETVEEFLADYYVWSLEKDDVQWAIDNRRNEDFEDALQIAIAIRNGCSEFVTLDEQLAKTYESLPTLKIKLIK